ncbi:hypothetical protein AB7M63_007361 [Bradyrhizobium japonicum]
MEKSLRKFVMPGLVPGIHVLGAPSEAMDGRDKPGHDDLRHGAATWPIHRPPATSLNRHGVMTILLTKGRRFRALKCQSRFERTL